MSNPCRPRILFLNRSYWPDAEATGQLLTELCEDLADRFDVTVIAGQPNCNADGVAFRRRGDECRGGVTIRRVCHTRFSKRTLLGRLCNQLSFLAAATVAALTVKRPDVVVAETDPPFLSLLAALVRRRFGCRLVVYLQDIHPDIAVAVGRLRDGRLVRRLRRMLFGVYRSADRVVVLSRDMQQRIVASGVSSRRTAVVPNWIDTSLVHPVKQNNGFRTRHGLEGQFLVMYSGNHGLCQQLEDVIAAAHQLRHRPDILFLLIGGGVMQPQLQDQAHRLGLTNVRFLPYQPKTMLAESLSAADLHLVPLDPRVADCLMPSKLYGVLASGTPLLAIAPDECELADLVREHDVGRVAPPGQPEALAEGIEMLADRQWDLEMMGHRARRLAEQQFDRHQVTARFATLLESMLEQGAGSRAQDEEQRSSIAHETTPAPRHSGQKVKTRAETPNAEPIS
jgi:colanic acid biosynthesis glycosyl transferase WcaI